MSINDDIIALITKKLKGLASAAELDEIENWIHLEPENRSEYELLEKTWRQTGKMPDAPAFDTTATWSKMEGLLSSAGEDRRVERPVSRVVTRRRLAMAAALFACIVTAWYLLRREPAKTVTVAASENQSVSLPDHSRVVVRKGSSIRYRSPFGDKKRVIELTGEAYFEVQRDEDRPFHILTKNAEVRVLGTSFLVRSTASRDEVMVTSGKVTVENREGSKQDVVLLTGQQVTLEDHRFRRSLVPDSNFLAWNTGVMRFDATPVSKVIEELGNYYGLGVDIPANDREKLSDMKVSVRFEKQPLSEVLEELRLITDLEITKAGGKIHCSVQH